MQNDDSESSEDIESMDQFKILKDGTNLNHYQETPVQKMSSASPMSPTRRRLDERITSRITQLMSKNTNETDETTLVESPETDKAHESAVKILKMQSICTLLNSNHFKYQYGSASTLAIGSLIAIGTSKGQILTFSFDQTSQNVYQDRKSLESGSITSLALSADSTYVAAGFEKGTIIIWDLNKPSAPILTIQELTQKDLARGTKEGHLVGSKIHHLSFVGKRHTALISADNKGFLCYHNGYRNVLGYHVISRKVLGKYSYQEASLTSHILTTLMLPLGSSVEATDSIGLTAIMTPNALIVISIYPELQTHFKIGRPSGISKQSPLSACVTWLPALKMSTGVTIPKLCYCWSNYLTVFDISHEVMKNENGDESVFVKFNNKKRYVAREALVAVQFLNQNIIAALTNGNRILLINEANMQVLDVIDLLGKNISSLDFFGDDLFESVFSNSFKSFKEKLFIIGEADLYVVSLNNWADYLMSFMSEGQYLKALKKARELYLNTDLKLTIYGLPSSIYKRKTILSDHISQLLIAALDYTFKDEVVNQDTLVEFLSIYLQIYVDFKDISTPASLDLAFDKFNDSGNINTFFEVLKTFIEREEITQFSPAILQLLVKDFIANEQGEELEQLICLLDITSLDIDLTISLCQQYHLRDSLTFIWNVLMGDYITPLMDFIKLIVRYNESDGTDVSSRTELSRVYSYLTYTLTGRQYPTERLIDFTKMRQAKMTIYYVLFNGASLAWPKGLGKVHIMKDIKMEPAFPYLYLLLKFNCFETIGALNEIFEDDFLNDDSESDDVYSDFQLKATRQYIIDILFEVFNSSGSEFSQLDNTYLAIFVARNYPKFRQFINLSDSKCEDLIEALCAYPNADLKEDCELSLQSLLSTYHPLNVSDLIYFFERAGFYDVLFSVYKSEQKFHKVLEIWLSNKERAQLEKEVLNKITVNYEKDSDIVRKCFELTTDNTSERAQVVLFIRNNFDKLVQDDLFEMIKLFSKFCPDLNSEVLNIENDNLSFKFLDVLFKDFGLQGTSKNTQNRLKFRYIELLSQYDRKELYNFLSKTSTVENIQDIIPILRKNRAVDSVVHLMKRENDLVPLIQEISSYFLYLKQEILEIIRHELSTEKFQDIEADLWKYLFMGIDICEHELQLKLPVKNLTPNEWLWLTIIESTVDILRAVNSETSGKNHDQSVEKIVDTIKRLVQDLFTSLINSRSVEDLDILEPEEKKSSQSFSFFQVFNEFLLHSAVNSQEITRLSDVRSVLREIFLSYKYDTVLQGTVLKLISSRIFEEFEKLNGHKLRGLTSGKADCDACGKPLWGAKISNEVYDEWAEAQLQKLGTQSENGDVADDSVYIFTCVHRFHGRCIKNLAGGVTDKCIICDA